MYLFKNDQDKWIMGNTIYSECPAGKYRIDPSPDYLNVTIRLISTDVPIFRNEPIRNFLKEDGTRYASFNEFKAAYDGFFQEAGGGEISGSVTESNSAAILAKQSNGTQKTQVVDANGVNEFMAGKPLRSAATMTRPSNTDNYAQNDAVGTSTSAPAATEFTLMSRSSGGGGILMDLVVETDAVQFAGCTLRLWLFNAAPEGIQNDNAAYVNSWANRTKRIGYVDVTFDPLLGASDTIIGKASPAMEYNCAATSIFVLFQTLSAVTSPKSGGVLYVKFNAIQL